MNKLWLIVQREYLTRVLKRSFILTTLLTPLAIVAFTAIVAWIFSYSSDARKIAVKNESGFKIEMPDSKRAYFSNQTGSIADLKNSYKEDGYDGLLYIPELKNLKINDFSVKYYSDDQIPVRLKESIEDKLGNKIRELKIDSSRVDRNLLKSFDTNISLDEVGLSVNEEGELLEEDKENSAGIATAIGTIMGFIIYIVLFIYGTMVMHSVMEEKRNRIVEIIISSVKPFQLMLGKILGVGGVGLTQILIWMILIPSLTFVVSLFLPIDPNAINDSQLNTAEQQEMMGQMMGIMESLQAQDWWLIVPMFVFYFLGGYFIYAALFAAVGSAIGDDLGESQSLTLPITIPVILAIYIMIAVVENPMSNLATFASIFPLFSMIVMPARLPFHPPMWEIIVSMIVMVASVIFFVWLSGRIYRVGILMYGKKVSLKELGKWMFYKE